MTETISPGKSAINFGITFGIIMILQFVIMYVLDINPQETPVIGVIINFLHLKCQKCHSHIYISNLCNSKYVKCTRRPAGTSTDLSKERQHRYIPTYFHNVRIYSRKTKMQNQYPNTNVNHTNIVTFLTQDIIPQLHAGSKPSSTQISSQELCDPTLFVHFSNNSQTPQKSIAYTFQTSISINTHHSKYQSYQSTIIPHHPKACRTRGNVTHRPIISSPKPPLLENCHHAHHKTTKTKHTNMMI